MCDFVFDPSLWMNSTSHNQPVRCPYRRVAPFDYCIFHLLPGIRRRLFPHPQGQIREMEKAVEAVGRIHLVCVTLPQIDLLRFVDQINPRSEVNILFSWIHTLNVGNLDVRNKVNIVESHVGSILGENAVFRDKFSIRGRRVDNIEMEGATFNRQCTFVDVDFGECNFNSATFKRPVSFQAPFAEDISIKDIEPRMGKDACHFHSVPSFMGVEFEDSVNFSGVIFEEAALFSFSKYHKGAIFHRVEFGYGVNFQSAMFDDRADFSGAELGIALFLHCEFDAIIDFSDATFGHKNLSASNNVNSHCLAEGINTEKIMEYEKVRENEFINDYTHRMGQYAAQFNQSITTKFFKAEDIKIHGAVSFDSMSFEYLQINAKTDKRQSVISLHSTHIKDGQITIDDESCFYDLLNANLGEVILDVPERVGLFDNFYINNTTMDEFNFANYRPQLREIGWNIDNSVIEGSHISPDRQETTYAKAKAGAAEQGDQVSESKFFILERRRRLDRYREQRKNAEGYREWLSSMIRIAVNRSYDILSVYGESSLRVFGWSVVTIGVFSFLLNSLLGRTTEFWFGGEVPFTGIGLYFDLDNVVLSVQSFTSFIPGIATRELDIFVQLVTAVESFLGAFFVALFVATVVRKIER